MGGNKKKEDREGLCKLARFCFVLAAFLFFSTLVCAQDEILVSGSEESLIGGVPGEVPKFLLTKNIRVADSATMVINNTLLSILPLSDYSVEIWVGNNGKLVVDNSLINSTRKIRIRLVGNSSLYVYDSDIDVEVSAETTGRVFVSSSTLSERVFVEAGEISVVNSTVATVGNQEFYSQNMSVFDSVFSSIAASTVMLEISSDYLFLSDSDFSITSGKYAEVSVSGENIFLKGTNISTKTGNISRMTVVSTGVLELSGDSLFESNADGESSSSTLSVESPELLLMGSGLSSTASDKAVLLIDSSKRIVSGNSKLLVASFRFVTGNRTSEDEEDEDEEEESYTLRGPVSESNLTVRSPNMSFVSSVLENKATLKNRFLLSSDHALFVGSTISNSNWAPVAPSLKGVFELNNTRVNGYTSPLVGKLVFLDHLSKANVGWGITVTFLNASRQKLPGALLEVLDFFSSRPIASAVSDGEGVASLTLRVETVSMNKDDFEGNYRLRASHGNISLRRGVLLDQSQSFTVTLTDKPLEEEKPTEGETGGDLGGISDVSATGDIVSYEPPSSVLYLYLLGGILLVAGGYIRMRRKAPPREAPTERYMNF